MEKSRAIELLGHLAWDRDIERNPYGDALNMAIEALKAQLSKGGTTSDTISRQAAIDALDKRFDSIPMEQTAEVLKLRKDLRELPPAQPEPHEGHWIDKYPTTYICSECGWLIPDSKVKVFAYCPNCGAKMKGERQK